VLIILYCKPEVSAQELYCKPELSNKELYRKAMIARNDATNNGAKVLGLILNKVISAPCPE
jgi:hypothetical protein